MSANRITFRLLAMILMLAVTPSALLLAGPAVDLARQGQARWPVVVAEQADQATRDLAEQLADYLSRITGGPFAVQTGDGQSGIVVGLAESLPHLGFAELFDPTDPTQRETYLLRSHDRGLWVIGATPLAVENAVWDLLYRLGHRQFFPGPTWEVVPQQADLQLAVDTIQTPDYLSRRIWYGFGTWRENRDAYQQWNVRNRVRSGIQISTGHSYIALIRRQQAAFDQNPEFYALVDGQRIYRGSVTKLCIANDQLRALVVSDAIERMRQNPQADSLSMDPSDGGAWCECEPCAQLGSVSDRVALLTSEVAEAVARQVGPRYVGIYAYHQHAPPPSVAVHPNVVVSVATAFGAGLSVEDRLAGWQRQGAKVLGIREYYSVNTWDRDLPGRMRASNLSYLGRTIRDYHHLGARHLSAESSENWGPAGLGYYLAARMMWDTSQADQVASLLDDFYQKAFGPAGQVMRQYYELIGYGDHRPLLSDDLIGRMFRAIAQARSLAQSHPRVLARLDDLLLYTHYVALYKRFSEADDQDQRQAAYEVLIQHAYRMRQTMMVHSLALYRDLAGRNRRTITVPENAAWNVNEADNPWKSSEPFTRADYDSLLAEGIAQHPLYDFEPVAFSEDLVPAARALNLQAPPAHPAPPAGQKQSLRLRGTRTFYTWVDQAPAQIRLRMTSGEVYDGGVDAVLELWPLEDPQGQMADQANVPRDKAWHDVTLNTAFQGLHRIEFRDSGGLTTIQWEPGTYLTHVEMAGRHTNPHHRHSRYFYVPRGTRQVAGYATGVGAMLDADGNQVHIFDGSAGYFNVPVTQGQDGRLWLLQRNAGVRYLMTVPPYLAQSPEQLLLPAEVVARDAREHEDGSANAQAGAP